MTTIYIMRHSEPFNIHKGIDESNDNLLLSNQKSPLSINGERLAEKISLNDEFSNLDVIWSSNYVRAMSTAKYFAEKNNLKVNITDKIGERIHGINSWDELPKDFEMYQFKNEDYKIGYGESQKEVRNRFLTFINAILDSNINKKVLLVSHATATAFLLMNWCDMSYDKNSTFNGNVFFDGKWNYCQTFKLIFDDNKKLINIESIKF